MYTSGGDLHLELPTGQQGGTKKLWVSITFYSHISVLIIVNHCRGTIYYFHVLNFLCFIGDRSFRDKGCDESQLLLSRR